jgi:hypothetical protein
MSTVTFQIDDVKAKRLAEAAREMGVPVEELLQRITDDFLAKPRAVVFQSTLAESMRENAELLRRLAK